MNRVNDVKTAPFVEAKVGGGHYISFISLSRTASTASLVKEAMYDTIRSVFLSRLADATSPRTQYHDQK